MPTKVNMPDGRVINFPDMMSEADIERALHDLNDPKMMASHEPAPERTWTDTAVDALPLAGGMAGGMLGAAGGIAGGIGGAALGGAAGEAGKQLVNRYRGRAVPTSATDAATDIGIAGAEQGGLEAGGRMLQGTLRMAGPRIYQGLLKPSVAARAEHPDLVKTALENGIAITERGADKAGVRVGESKAKADALVAARAAEPNAPTIDPRQAVAGITPAVKAVKDLPVARPQMKAIGDYARAYIGEHQRPMALPDAQRAVRATDDFFNSAYRSTMDRGNPVTAGGTAAALGINNETRGLLREAVPGLREQNAATSSMAGLREAVERRVGQQGNLSPVGMQHLINAGLGTGAWALGGKEKGVATFGAMEAVTNPAIGSHLAINAYRAGRIPFAQAVRAALMAKLLGEEEQPGGSK